MEDLQGKVAVITGGASGIGLAMARRFASEGARLALLDVARPALDAVADDLRRGGADVLTLDCDVSDPAEVDQAGRQVVDHYGSVNVVCNNAGVIVMGRVWEVSQADWERIFSVNFWGVVHGVRTFVPLILAGGQPGYVVNTASMAGVTSLPTLGPYCATKHAVVALSEVLHHDLAAEGADIGVSVLCPGLVATHLGQEDKLAGGLISGPNVKSADEVAEDVRRAMADRRFYIFTHEGSERQVEARMRSIVDGLPPTFRPLPRDR